MKELVEEAKDGTWNRTWQVVTVDLCQRGEGGHGDQDDERTSVTVCGQVQDSGIHLQSGWKDAGQLGKKKMQSANEAWWRDVKIDRSRDVPWRVKCRRMLDQVCSVLCFASENWCWSQTVLDRIKGGGDDSLEEALQDEKDGGRDDEGVLYKDCDNGKDLLKIEGFLLI